MTKPAAFRATYSDLRFVKTRKVCQVVLEMPLEQADAFLASFGTPNPAEEKWCALARLVDQKDDNPPPAQHDHKNWHMLRPSAQAGIRCDDPLFWQFLCVDDRDAAAEKVRWGCDVRSRAEMDRDADARTKWEEIDEQFVEWKRRRKL